MNEFAGLAVSLLGVLGTLVTILVTIRLAARNWTEERTRQRQKQLAEHRITVYSDFLADCVRALRAMPETESVDPHDPHLRDCVDAFLKSVSRCQLLCKGPELREAIDKLMQSIRALPVDFTFQDAPDLVVPIMAVVSQMEVEVRGDLELRDEDGGRCVPPIKPSFLEAYLSIAQGGAANSKEQRQFKELPHHPATAARGARKYYWLNSCERYQKKAYEKMLEKNIACTYGPPVYKDKLSCLFKGDRIVLYVSDHGVVAIGTVNGTDITTREPGNGYTGADDTEYSIPVHWDKKFPLHPIKAPEVRQAGNYLFIPTFFWLHEDIGKKLEERADERKKGEVAGRPPIRGT